MSLCYVLYFVELRSRNLVRPRGFEPLTFCSGVKRPKSRRSIKTGISHSQPVFRPPFRPPSFAYHLPPSTSLGVVD
jgi:hypothetical protein